LVGGCLAGTPRLECEHDAKTESIAQRSRRSQRVELDWSADVWREHCGLGASMTRKRKASHGGHRGHRGGIGLVGGSLAGTPRLECERHAKTESIARRSRRSQRVELDWSADVWREHRSLSARVTRKRKASHRGHGGHRGGIGLVGGRLAGTPRLKCEGHAKTESIAQRSRRSQRGNWIGRRMSGGNTAAWVRKSREGRRPQKGKARMPHLHRIIDSATFGVSGISTSTASARALSNEQ
jgi:hypothetical protein